MYDDTCFPNEDEVIDGEGELPDVDDERQKRFIEANKWLVEEEELPEEEDDDYYIVGEDDVYSMPDEDEQRNPAREPGEAENYDAEAFRLEVLDLFLRSLTDDSVLDDAPIPQLLRVFDLIGEFKEATNAGNCPKGLYETAIMAGKLYDELFAAS